jgi:cell wall-associated NlpC family hydrolase
MAQLGDPYEWAATGPNRWDCSGLTMMSWRAGGVSLPHWSVAQWEASTPVSAGAARPGDLVFYAYDLNDFRSIHHVALYLGNGLMIEAPFTGANVRISSVDRPDLFGFGRP